MAMHLASGFPARPRTRFAPTPSGYLHAGNAWCFLVTWLTARSLGGSVHLRIDDLDSARFREEYLEDIFSSLEWLGLDWDSGPRDPRDFHAGFSQRHRLPAYNDALARLSVTWTGGGPSVYACACSREKARRDAESAGRPGPYPGTCRNAGLPLDSGAPWRLRVPDNLEVTVPDLLVGGIRMEPGMDMGDFVIRLRNGDPCYQLASVLDDEIFGIDLVVRGLDLLPSTGAQLFLAGLMGAEVLPKARFIHHGLLTEPEGEKLSKSAGAVSLSSLRGRLDGPGPLLRWFAGNLGMDAPASVRPRDLLEGFSPARIPTRPLSWEDLLRESGLA